MCKLFLIDIYIYLSVSDWPEREAVINVKACQLAQRYICVVKRNINSHTSTELHTSAPHPCNCRSINIILPFLLDAY